MLFLLCASSSYVALRLARRFASIDLVQRQPSALAAAQALETAALDFTIDASGGGKASSSSSAWDAKVDQELLPALAAVGLGSRAISNEVAAVHFRNDTLPNALLGRYLEVRKDDVGYKRYFLDSFRFFFFFFLWPIFLSITDFYSMSRTGQRGACARHHGERASGHEVSPFERVVLRPERLPPTGAFPLQACPSPHP